MKFISKRIALVVVMLVSLYVSVISADTLRMAYYAAPQTVDPYKSSASPTASLNEHIYEALVSRTDKKLLATSWHWKDDTTLVFNLRKGVRFHNGDAFSARDVVYSACRMMFRVSGKKNMLTSAMSPVTDVVAVNDNTVEFKTVQPYPILTAKLKSLAILPSGLANLPVGNIKYDNKGNCGITNFPTRAQFESGRAAIGTGPYKLQKFENTGNADLVRNNNYWGSRPNWERVEIRSVKNSGARMAGLLAGDFNVIENPTTEDVTSLKGNDDYSYTSEPSWRSIFLILDVGSDVAPGVLASDGKNPLKDLRVRQAMSLAINRQAIVDHLMGGMATVANQFAPSYQKGADPNMPALEYDPQKAKRFLAAAGYPDGFQLDLHAPNDRYVNGTRVAQAIAQYFSKIGLKVNLKAKPWSVFRKGRSKRKLGVFMYGWGHPQGPAQMTSYAFATRNKNLNLGASNYSNYHNDAFDAAMSKWAVEIDMAKSHGYAQEAMRIAVRDLPGIPLYYQHSLWAHDSNLTVEGRPDERSWAEMVSKK